MPVVAAALRGGQGNESAVRLGNDNIEHARPPRTVCGSTSTRVSTAALQPRGDWIAVDLPRAWCARSVSSFCVALFCKTSGSTRTMQSRKKKRRAAERVATLRERNGRVYWMLDMQPRRGTEGYWTVRHRFPSAPRRAPPLLADAGRLDDSAANRRVPSHCLHASHWIVIFVGVGRRRPPRRRRCALCVQRRERGATLVRENKRDTETRTRARVRFAACCYRQRRYQRRIQSGYQAHLIPNKRARS